jgi:hypothetical protein
MCYKNNPISKFGVLQRKYERLWENVSRTLLNMIKKEFRFIFYLIWRLFLHLTLEAIMICSLYWEYKSYSMKRLNYYIFIQIYSLLNLFLLISCFKLHKLAKYRPATLNSLKRMKCFLFLTFSYFIALAWSLLFLHYYSDKADLLYYKPQEEFYVLAFVFLFSCVFESVGLWTLYTLWLVILGILLHFILFPIILVFGLIIDMFAFCCKKAKKGPNAKGEEERQKVYEIESECAICTEKMSANERLSLPCYHIFHPTCLKAMLDRHKKCPLCRKDIPKLLLI